MLTLHFDFRWNPWPWMDVLDKIGEFYGPSGDLTLHDIDFYDAVYDKIDFDGDGEINYIEIYDALHSAGLDITEEGVMNLVAMIDEDGNGK
jgi:hypothetical protein